MNEVWKIPGNEWNLLQKETNSRVNWSPLILMIIVLLPANQIGLILPYPLQPWAHQKPPAARSVHRLCWQRAGLHVGSGSLELRIGDWAQYPLAKTWPRNFNHRKPLPAKGRPRKWHAVQSPWLRLFCTCIPALRLTRMRLHAPVAAQRRKQNGPRNWWLLLLSFERTWCRSVNDVCSLWMLELLCCRILAAQMGLAMSSKLLSKSA